jgi:hypothetical protein
MQTRQAIAPLDIKIGSAVQCRDGRADRVIKLVVEPGSKRVTRIVVARCLLLHRDVVVPIERVARVQGNTVVLDMGESELNIQPAYAEVDYAVPDSSWTAQYGHARDDTLVDLRSYTPTDRAHRAGRGAPERCGAHGGGEARGREGGRRRRRCLGGGERVAGQECRGHGRRRRTGP